MQSEDRHVTSRMGVHCVASAGPKSDKRLSVAATRKRAQKRVLRHLVRPAASPTVPCVNDSAAQHMFLTPSHCSSTVQCHGPKDVASTAAWLNHSDRRQTHFRLPLGVPPSVFCRGKKSHISTCAFGIRLNRWNCTDGRFGRST